MIQTKVTLLNFRLVKKKLLNKAAIGYGLALQRHSHPLPLLPLLPPLLLLLLLAFFDLLDG